MNEIKDLTPKDIGKGADMDLIIKELQSLNKIAVLKEEGFVIKRLMTGHSKNSIARELQKKYPEEKITLADINDFIRLYRDVLYQEKTDIEKAYVRRLIKSQEGLSNRLIELADRAQSFVDKCEEDNDNTNAIAALRTSADIFMKLGKLQGLFVDKPEVNINMQMDRVVNEVTSKDSEFKKSIIKIMKKEDEKVIDGEIVDE